MVAAVKLLPLLTFGLSAMLPAAAATDWTKVPHLTAADEEITAKDWALSVCIGKLAKGTKLANDSNRTAAALLERGSIGADVYRKMTQLADIFIARPYGGSTGGSYNLLKCLDLYHSRELDQLTHSARVRSQ